jgi:hypothetical protein
LRCRVLGFLSTTRTAIPVDLVGQCLDLLLIRDDRTADRWPSIEHQVWGVLTSSGRMNPPDSNLLSGLEQ